MKLLYCKTCQDVVKLQKEVRFCACTKSYGRYLEDGLKAEYFGPATLIGLDNKTFAHALSFIEKNPMEPKYCIELSKWQFNVGIKAFIISPESKNIKFLKDAKK